jgi:two-component system sensor histidine kinase DesK
MPDRAALSGWLLLDPSQPDLSGSFGDHAASPPPDPPETPAESGLGGPRLAGAILITVLCAFLAVQVIDILTSPIPSEGLDLGVGLASVAVVFTLQVLNSSSKTARWPLWRRVAMLIAQGLVTYLPLIVLGKEWAGMAGFLAGSVLLLLPGWWAWGCFTAVVASMLVGPVVFGLDAYSVAYLAVASLDIGLVVFGLSRLSLVIRYAYATRAELAQLAIVRERVRFARDLHDLLGYSLSAITLKAELGRRLVESNPGRARDELAEILDVSRQALADVRLVASGYRNLSLSKEAASVTSLMAAAGIAVQSSIDCGALDEKVDTVLATVLREAVTNLLRHSSARSCIVEVSQAEDSVSLRIVNDGVPRSARSSRKGGGLENLAVRLASVGGTLRAVVCADGRFDLLAQAPLPAADALTEGAA